ncbi:unnamed protein product, partial [Mesorhabditis belari]|uniref:Carbohydrate sulfotransferase n=1 Tax=Mesorhabditis belari TaxID=2138241 RepID=A0AAF3EJS0_9BILA
MVALTLFNPKAMNHYKPIVVEETNEWKKRVLLALSTIFICCVIVLGSATALTLDLTTNSDNSTIVCGEALLKACRARLELLNGQHKNQTAEIEKLKEMDDQMEDLMNKLLNCEKNMKHLQNSVMEIRIRYEHLLELIDTDRIGQKTHIENNYAALEIGESHINQIGLFYCMIPKNGATITKIMLCDLYRYFRQIPFKAAFGPKKKLSECKLKKWKLDYKNNQNKWEVCQNPVRFVLIREPLKRFLSLYGYLCDYLKMCGSEIDIHKFTKDVYLLLSTRSVKETNFVEKHGDIVIYHAQPQSWFCNLSEELKKFHLIHHNSNRLEMRSEFQKIRYSFIFSTPTHNTQTMRKPSQRF